MTEEDYDEVIDDEEIDYDEPDWEDETETGVPEQQAAALFKYQVEADIPKKQKDALDDYRPFYGRHTALGNTKRTDNIRILDSYDLTTILDDCPTLRHRATRIRGRTLTELQLFRSNGGFERQMETTVTKSLQVKDNRITPVNEPEKKKRLSLFKGRK